jgi:DnaJ-class molecular chaperone
MGANLVSACSKPEGARCLSARIAIHTNFFRASRRKRQVSLPCTGLGEFLDAGIPKMLNRDQAACEKCLGTGHCPTCTGTGIAESTNSILRHSCPAGHHALVLAS